MVSTHIIRTSGRLNENTQIFNSQKFMCAKCTICSFAKVYACRSFSRKSYCARKFLCAKVSVRESFCAQKFLCAKVSSLKVSDLKIINPIANILHQEKYNTLMPIHKGHITSGGSNISSIKYQGEIIIFPLVKLPIICDLYDN